MAAYGGHGHCARAAGKVYMDTTTTQITTGRAEIAVHSHDRVRTGALAVLGTSTDRHGL